MKRLNPEGYFAFLFFFAPLTQRVPLYLLRVSLSVWFTLGKQKFPLTLVVQR